MAGLLIPAKTAVEIAGRFVWVAMIRCFFYTIHLSTFSNIRFCVKDAITNMDINLKIFFLQKFSSSSARCHCLHLVTIAIKSLNFQKKKKKTCKTF